MRKSTMLVAIGIATCPLAMAAPPDEPRIVEAGQTLSSEPLTYRRLDDQDALDKLLATNPRHYAIARRILAAANEICDVSKGSAVRTMFHAKYVACTAGMWLTSNPPKHQLSFRIDETVYSALIAVALHTRIEPIPRLETSPDGRSNGRLELIR
jgi:hypothetical protein